MKKRLIGMLILMTSMCFCGCGEKENANTDVAVNSAPVEETEAVEETEIETETDELVVKVDTKHVEDLYRAKLKELIYNEAEQCFDRQLMERLEFSFSDFNGDGVNELLVSENWKNSDASADSYKYVDVYTIIDDEVKEAVSIPCEGCLSVDWDKKIIRAQYGRGQGLSAYKAYVQDNNLIVEQHMIDVVKEDSCGEVINIFSFDTGIYTEGEWDFKDEVDFYDIVDEMEFTPYKVFDYIAKDYFEKDPDIPTIIEWSEDINNKFENHECMEITNIRQMGYNNNQMQIKADVYGYLTISESELSSLRAGQAIEKNGYQLTYESDYEVPFSNGRKAVSINYTCEWDSDNCFINLDEKQGDSYVCRSSVSDDYMMYSESTDRVFLVKPNSIAKYFNKEKVNGSVLNAYEEVDLYKYLEGDYVDTDYFRGEQEGDVILDKDGSIIAFKEKYRV